MEKTLISYHGYKFITGVSKKFDNDLLKVCAIMDKGTENLTAADRFQLCTIYKSAYHESGKIECVTSFDSSATNCIFCQAMRKAAANNPAHICNFCYDYSQEQYKLNSLNRHSLNMLIMSEVEFTSDELAIIPAGLLNRIDSAGDIPNKTYARNMIKKAMLHKDTHFAFWTKNTLALIAATDELGKPKNAVYIQSSRIIGRAEPLAKYFDYCFVVYPDKETTAEAIKAGASACNGRKCKECGFKCYYGTHDNTIIAELLRGVSKDKVAIIKEWLARN
jgi:hypothetical protein